MRKATAAVAAATLGIATLAASANGAQPRSGTISAFATQVPGYDFESVIVTGSIGDYGRAVSTDENGKPDLDGNFDTVTLQRGSFELDETALNQHLQTAAKQVLSKATCSGYATGSGTVSLVHGKGAYDNISGTLNITIVEAFVVPRYTSGAHKGDCEFTANVMPLADYTSAHASGTIRLG